jgi:ESCRT-II complex subunit VPS36
MLLPGADLSESGRPILQPGEIECHLIDSTDIDLDEEVKPAYWKALVGGIASLTTHRIIWLERTRRKQTAVAKAYAIPHSGVASVHPPKKGGLKSLFGKQAVKLRLRVWVRKDGGVAIRGAQEGAGTMQIVIIFRNVESNSDAFVSRLQVRTITG